MKKTNQYILIASLVFNIAFISIFIYRSVQFHRFEQNGRMMPPPPPEFKEAFRKAKKDHPEMEKVRLQNFENRMRFFEMLSEDQPDYQQINLIADSLILSQYKIEKNITLKFIEARKNMKTEEAQEFFGRLSQHAAHGCERIKSKENRRKK